MAEETPGTPRRPRRRATSSAAARPTAKRATPRPAASDPAPAAPKPRATRARKVPTPAPAPEPATAEPRPLEVPLEEQINDLPPLEFPGGPNREFAEWAAERRQGRLRVEIIGGALLVLAGIAATVFSGRIAFVVISVFLVGCLGAYEFLVTSFE